MDEQQEGEDRVSLLDALDFEFLFSQWRAAKRRGENRRQVRRIIEIHIYRERERERQTDRQRQETDK